MLVNRLREPQPIILPELKKRSATSHIEAVAETTLTDECLDHPKWCGQCGQQRESGARFCGQCGKQFVPGATILVSLRNVSLQSRQVKVTNRLNSVQV
ncbi:MAG TPA: hypothetical protein VFA10_30200 [Ktedonobacteraceae bacterium]|nr:hypothetical protein [Ktedonobacteraceae bacterium]